MCRMRVYTGNYCTNKKQKDGRSRGEGEEKGGKGKRNHQDSEQAEAERSGRRK